jgi:hypothetical protein
MKQSRSATEGDDRVSATEGDTESDSEHSETSEEVIPDETPISALTDPEHVLQTAAAVLLAMRHGETICARDAPETKRKKRALATDRFRCGRCGTSKTPLWRKMDDDSARLCNACGIYFKTHGKPRPTKWFRTSN